MKSQRPSSGDGDAIYSRRKQPGEAERAEDDKAGSLMSAAEMRAAAMSARQRRISSGRLTERSSESSSNPLSMLSQKSGWVSARESAPESYPSEPALAANYEGPGDRKASPPGNSRLRVFG